MDSQRNKEGTSKEQAAHARETGMQKKRCISSPGGENIITSQHLLIAPAAGRGTGILTAR
jgi:hypothetical protein